MKITYRAMTEKEFRRAQHYRLRSFVAFLGTGAILVIVVLLLGAPYGMRPAGWPWTPADWYGVNLGLLLALVLLAGSFLAFSQKMLHVDILVRRRSTRIIQFAAPMTVLALFLGLAGAAVVVRLGWITWAASTYGWQPGWVWSTRPSSDPIVHVAFAGDGLSLHAWYKSGAVRTWLVGRGKELGTDASLTTGPVSLSSGAFVLQEKRATAGNVAVEATGSGGSDLKVLWLKENKQRPIVTHQLSPVTCLALSGDGELALSGSKDRDVRVWETGSAKDPRKLTGTGPVSAVALSSDKLIAASGQEDGKVLLWNLKGIGAKLSEMSDPRSTTAVSVLQFDGTGNLLGSMDTQSGLLYVWDAQHFKLFGRPVETPFVDATHLALAPDGRYAIVVRNSSTINLLRLLGGP